MDVRKISIILVAFSVFLFVGGSIVLVQLDKEDTYVDPVNTSVEDSTVKRIEEDSGSNSQELQTEKEDEIEVNTKSYSVNLPTYYSQTFNNCGPATLAMNLNYYGVNTNQDILGDKLRPNQNPQGINDDKSVRLEEMAEEAREQGFIAYYRPNGTINKLKQFVANDIPVITVTWLNPGEDIGHYRIVRGFNDNKQEILQDDSYHGTDLTYSYEVFNSMWQPFNYKYLVVAEQEDKELVERVLGEEIDDEVAWENVLKRAEEEQSYDNNYEYTLFNQSVANYYLGNYATAVKNYQDASSNLPRRMLWYQLEPIKAYAQVEEYDTVFNLTENILENGNKAYEEIYKLRGDVYKKQGEIEKAREQYQIALNYNPNYEEARDALNSL